MIVDRSRRCRLDGAFQNPRFSSLFSSSIQQLSLSLSLSLSLCLCLCLCVWASVRRREKKGEKGGEKSDVREMRGRKERKGKREGEGGCCTCWEEGGDKVILSHPTLA
jgi:hypothetical protein